MQQRFEPVSLPPVEGCSYLQLKEQISDELLRLYKAAHEPPSIDILVRLGVLGGAAILSSQGKSNA